jgi:hypothetical protein
VKEVVTRQGLQEDVLLKKRVGRRMQSIGWPHSLPRALANDDFHRFVCATSKQTSETVCLTSYKSPRGSSDLLNSVKIWEACRATSAASSFFDPIAIGRCQEEFVDVGNRSK